MIARKSQSFWMAAFHGLKAAFCFAQARLWLFPSCRSSAIDQAQGLKPRFFWGLFGTTEVVP